MARDVIGPLNGITSNAIIAVIIDNTDGRDHFNKSLIRNDAKTSQTKLACIFSVASRLSKREKESVCVSIFRVNFDLKISLIDIQVEMRNRQRADYCEKGERGCVWVPDRYN